MRGLWNLLSLSQSKLAVKHTPRYAEQELSTHLLLLGWRL
jgi:hypothetical protein